MKTSNKVFGIDLGTTYSCVSYVGETGKPEIVPNDNFERTTPSVVWFDGSRVVVGADAKEATKTDPANVCSFIKRSMGDETFYAEYGGTRYSPEEISGMNTESSVPGEGTITYDICFYAMIPGGEQVKLIINVEAQKSFYPGYDIVTRAVFYCARLLSAQCGTEFTPRNYNDIKKVYSIWICMDVPQKMEYKITKYKMNKEEVYGQVSDEGRYDLLEVVMICLGREEKLTAGTMLHGLLSTLLSDELEPNEKKQILKQEYGIATSVEMEGGLQKMCNLSEMIEEKAIKRGMAKGIEKGIEKGTYMTLVSLVKDNILSEADAAARCGLSVEEFHKILESTHTS